MNHQKILIEEVPDGANKSYFVWIVGLMILFGVMVFVIFRGVHAPTDGNSRTLTQRCRIVIIYVVSFVIPSVDETSEILVNATWQCGTDEFSESLSEEEVMTNCPELRDPINSCCHVHDKCYKDQLGQQHCDDQFCDCLERRTRNYGTCHNVSSPFFCEMVRMFGSNAYRSKKLL